ncbi:hypothetical protein ACFL6Y_03505 [Elusimicrobiota bacterium]
MDNIVKIFRESLSMSVKAPVLFMPLMVIGLMNSFVSVFWLGPANPAEIVGIGVYAPVLSIGVISMLAFIAVGPTIAMAKELWERDSTSLDIAFAFLKERFKALFIAGFLSSLIIFAGVVFFFIPGVIAAYLLQFTFPALVVKQVSGTEAIRESCVSVRANIAYSLMAFIGLILVGFIIGILGGLFSAIPLIGKFLSSIFGALIGGYSSVVIIRVYMTLPNKT